MTGKQNSGGGPPPFEITLEQHGPRVHAWLIARVGPDRADDVFQETMLAALRAWDETSVESVRAWLFTIARNKAIDEDRQSVRRPDPRGDADQWSAEDAGRRRGSRADGGPDAGPRGWPAADFSGLMEDPIWDEVRALPVKQRTAVTLRFRGDLTHREIATLMETSEAAARRNVFEGLKSLRERMHHE